MRFKVGDKVRIKSIDWYNENKGADSCVHCGDRVFDNCMSVFCGSVVTIGGVSLYGYDIREDLYCRTWTDEMFEELVEEEMSLDKAGQITDFEYEGLAYTLPEGYQFKDENGNVINATKIVLEKKKKEYPKTYEECCEVLGLNSEIIDSELLFYHSLKCGEYTTIRLPEMEKFEKFIQLYLCRNAYWKLYGDEMGLGKPWKPRWNDSYQKKWIINFYQDEINLTNGQNVHFVLAFPTAEMRDAFKENFDPDIEICKEFL